MTLPLIVILEVRGGLTDFINASRITSICNKVNHITLYTTSINYTYMHVFTDYTVVMFLDIKRLIEIWQMHRN